MRIVSGTHKSRKITAPKNLPVRPTTDLAKEALFNILNNQFNFSEISVLDLFSGTGNISYEFASRGSKNIIAVDAHYGCVQFIKKTAETFGMEMDVYKSDVFAYLERNKKTFDLIFADPPYDLKQEDFERIVHLNFENKNLNEEGLLIIEHAKQTSLAHLKQYSYQKNYGNSVFSFFEYYSEN
uniref:RsmD family RNA methyltransferase n=2 Tax=Flavobacterium sp. TaxID=239 RepID=UPI00404B1988